MPLARFSADAGAGCAARGLHACVLSANRHGSLIGRPSRPVRCRRTWHCLPQEYLAAIKGVGVYRANAGPHDQPRWEAYNAAKPSN